MFSQVSVRLFVHRRVCVHMPGPMSLPRGVHAWSLVSSGEGRGGEGGYA